MYSQDSAYYSDNARDEFDVPITPSPPPTLLSPIPSSCTSVVSEDYDRELETILEKYEEAAKNEQHYLLYTQFPHGACQIGCGLSPARSFTPAVVMCKDQWEKISFSQYEWEQVIDQLRYMSSSNDEIKCGDYCKLRQVKYEDTTFIKLTKHNLDFFLSEMDVMSLVHINNELLVPYISMLEKIEFPSYYYNVLNLVKSSFADETYTFSSAFNRLQTFKYVQNNLQNVALGQLMYYCKHKIVNDFERFVE